MRQAAAAWRAEGKSIALVPTSGALHAGHRCMIEAALTKARVVVVSIFVNPLQFGPNEHYANYPRPIEQDIALCQEAGATAVFAPSAEEMYPKGYSTYVTEELIAKPLTGVSRPSHFRGLTTAIAKLLNITRPDCLVMGEKDAQTVSVVRKVISDLCFGVELSTVPNQRDADGLSLHVRNAELTPTQRNEALAIPRAVECAKAMVASGQRSVDRVIAEVTHILRQQRRVRVIFVAIVDPDTMENMREVVPGRSLLMIAAWVDEIRLSDNTPL
jgi:pantoate--beta-alanine ligase